MVEYIKRVAPIYEQGNFDKDEFGKPHYADGSPGDPWLPEETEVEDWGRLRVVINSVDVSFWRGARSVIEEYSSTDPFGDATATIYLPQVTEFDLIDVNEAKTQFGPAPRGALVTIEWISPAEEFVQTMWSGEVVGYQDRDPGIAVECAGTMYALDRFVKYPDYHTDDGLGTRDTATHIEGYLNFLHLFYDIPINTTYTTDGILTGILQRNPGAFEPLVTGWMSDLLAKAQKATVPGADPKAYTLECIARQPRVKLRQVDKKVYQFQAGAPGVKVQLGVDYDEVPTSIFAEGVNEDNGTWRNTKYPKQNYGPPPAIPYGGPYEAGDSGAAVNQIKRALKRHGYGSGLSPVGSPLVASDFIDGPIGWFKVASGNILSYTPDNSWEEFDSTDWANLFVTASGEPGYPVFLPIYEDPRAHPHLHDARGNVIGENPFYAPPGDTNHLRRVEAFRDYGNSNKFAAAIQARREIEFPGALNHVGTITCQTDPQEFREDEGGLPDEQRSRFQIRAGQNIELLNYRNAGTRNFFVSKATHDPVTLTSTFTVNERQRDFMTLQAIHERNKAVREDPAARIKKAIATSRLREDRFPAWDTEAGGGVIEPVAVDGALNGWTVWPIPAARFGTITQIRLETDPISTFVFALWARKVTSDQVLYASSAGTGSLNPDLTEGINGFFEDVDEYFPAHLGGEETGLIYVGGRGGANGSLGWWPNEQGNHNDPDQLANITGEYRDYGGWEFYSDEPPWIYISVLSVLPTTISGKLYLAEIEADPS